jgi:hypothetical protein
MSAADGHVVRTEKLVDHGDPARRWNLVILAEGYREPEFPQFRTACANFINRLYATAPFTSMWCALNVYCVDVASNESGADEPAMCGDGTPGSGLSPRTFFDATYCVAATSRLLAGNEALALTTAQAAVPQVHATIIIVNSSRYGGAGGGVAWFSTHADAADIGIHELGHSAFHLADEYSDLNNAWPGGEPPEPNITIDTNRATTKWRDLILAATALPTMSNPDCSTTDNRASPVAVGTVGLFEGGGRARCGVWRPEHNCFMRTLGQPFCAACRRAIRSVLVPFMPSTLTGQAGVQYTGTLGGGKTVRFFTHSWPACWHVAWTVVPKTDSVAAGPDLSWKVKVERASREHITYWVEVSNFEPAPVEFEMRYEIFARH